MCFKINEGILFMRTKTSQKCVIILLDFRGLNHWSKIIIFEGLNNEKNHFFFSITTLYTIARKIKKNIKPLN